VRLVLLRLAEDEHHLLRLNHHIISDGHSWNLFFEELAELYKAELHGSAPPLPAERRLHYADFAAWERATLGEDSERLRADVDWWRSKLAGAPRRTALPFERRKPSSRAVPSDGVTWFSLQPEVSRRLGQLQRACGATYYMTRVAAFAALLAAETGREDLVIGTYASTRRLPETHDMFGFFTNLAPLRLRFTGDPCFRDWLARVRSEVTAMSAHSQSPYDGVCDALRTSGMEPPELNAICGTSAIMPRERFGGLELTPLYRHFGSMPWRFTLQLDPVWEDQRCLAAFDARLNDPRAVRRFVDRYTDLLAAVGAEPGRPLRELIPTRGGRLSRLLRRARNP
jgi:hypothetical protein